MIFSLIRPFGRGHLVFWPRIQLRFDQTEPAFENAARQGRGSLVSRKQVGDLEAVSYTHLTLPTILRV